MFKYIIIEIIAEQIADKLLIFFSSRKKDTIVRINVKIAKTMHAIEGTIKENITAIPPTF